jgi:gas vesicle protein
MSDSTVGSTPAMGESTTEQVKDQVRDKAQVAQDKARGAMSQARGRLGEQVDQRSTQAGDQVHSTAQDVRNVAEQLRNQGKDTPARVAEQVADRAESFGTYLRDTDGERLLRDVEDFARRQPMLVAAGGLALGFAASRFLKASSSHRYRAGTDRSYAGPSGYDVAAVTGTAYTSDPAYTGSDHGTETPFTQADVVPPVAGTYDPGVQAVAPATAPVDDLSGSRRDLDPLP